ncbi:MAG: protein translocase subunit SecF [Gammaproteobacteria bacterium]|nr:protein translocase subunit SecF [Gammaproteobacteria bacterium]MCW9030648.1 protein translocase subunit SecF [Gammaproteobacteria bacterium]
MQIFKETPTFDFMAKRQIALAFSLILIIASISSLAIKGLNFGLDFTGGTLIEVAYPQSADLNKIRNRLTAAGFGDAVVQNFGSSKDVLVRLAPRENTSSQSLGDKILTALKEDDTDVVMRRQEFVGPQVGDELREDGGLAMLIALAFILVYVMARFEYRFALGSIAALIHDVIITMGVFSFFQFDFDLTVLAAVLAVIGYSLNDTIVVFDRIRENFRLLRKHEPGEIVNASLNQTLSRTMMTSVTTLIVVVAMFVLGGELIHSFSIALIIGILVGTYSSIYVASSMVITLKITAESMMPVKKEGEDQEGEYIE